MSGLQELHRQLRQEAPEITEAVFDRLAPELIRLGDGPFRDAKDLNDPIWNLIALTGPQVTVLGLPLMQRLRRVRQLGLAYLVYPGAQHSRLEHSIGAMRASEIMLQRLVTEVEREFVQGLSELVTLAALVHDAGHMAFSHLSERVITTLFDNELTSCHRVLQEHFPDPVAVKEPEPPSTGDPRRLTQSKPPPAAELLSALFVLSPSMVEVLGALRLRYAGDEAAEAICGLIVGRPTELLRHKRVYFHYVKSMISGDIDCDKIDYVARDAYYAGLPVSADVNRLLSQLTPVRIDQYTQLDTIKAKFGDPHPDAYLLLGIRPAGASALEMLVMTRSYLFDRIYTHHKIRGAERLLERLLREFLQYHRRHKQWHLGDCLEFLFDRGGDDAVLAKMSAWPPGGVDCNNEAEATAAMRFSSVANRLLDRDLPQRALAISSRTMAEYQPQMGRTPTRTFLPWSLAFEDLAQRTLDVEDQIRDVLELPTERDIFVDWPVANPVKENPDIWVEDRSTPGELLRVNRYFDAEQLSNAYRDVKMTAWVFANRNVRERVAAATAFSLYRQYDLLIGPEALRRAKVSYNGYAHALRQLPLNSVDAGIARDLMLSTDEDRRIVAPPASFGPWLANLGSSASDVALRMSRQLSQARLPRSAYEDLEAALVLLKFLLQHCQTYNRHAFFRQSIMRNNEARFQRHLLDFLTGNQEFRLLFKAEEGTRSSGGPTDLVVRSTSVNLPPIVIELKSERRRFEALYDKHAGQSQQYASTSYGRVTFLYCQYFSREAVRLPDTLQIRRNQLATSPQATICMGQQAFADMPSSGGATTVRA